MTGLRCAVSAALLFMSGISASAQGLKDVYKDYFMIGVAVNQRNVTNKDQQDLICREFNSLTAENDMKPQPTEPREGQFNWDNADRIANFCRQNGIKLRGHCLMWHAQIGEWMLGDNPTKEVFYARMKNHIQAIVSRYKDVVYCWDVVNEAISDDPKATDPYRQSPMYKLCGDEFIAKAFEYAREADPNALLFYNDYSTVDAHKRERIYQMVKKMKEAGVPIDGIGMQGHYNIYFPTEQLLDSAIVRFKEIVDHIHVTELDIRINQEMGGQLRFSREAQTVSDSVKQHLADARVFGVLRKHHDVIDCVTFWNLSDRDSWLGAANYPLPFDSDYQPKMAYDYIKDMKTPAWNLPKAPERRPRQQNTQRPPFNPDMAFPESPDVKEDFKPSSMNQPRQQYPQVNSQGIVRFRIEHFRRLPRISVIGAFIDRIEFDRDLGNQDIVTARDGVPDKLDLPFGQLGQEFLFYASQDTQPVQVPVAYVAFGPFVQGNDMRAIAQTRDNGSEGKRVFGIDEGTT